MKTFLLLFHLYLLRQYTCNRVRRLAANENAKMSFDFNFVMPVPVMGSMDVQGVVEVPVSVSLTNESFNWSPITLPYFVLQNSPSQGKPSSSPLPVPFPAVFHAPEDAVKFMQNHQNHQFYLHQVVKRQASEISSRHRSEFLYGIASTLEQIGLNGTSCIAKFICQLSHAPLLVETVIHEIIAHILSIPALAESSLDDAFVQANYAGSQGADCSQLYSSCLLELFAIH